MIEFEVNEYKLRFKDMNPITLLAMQTLLDMKTMKKTEELFTIVLENTEVEIAGTYVPLKAKGRNVYLPENIDKDFDTLNTILSKFIELVLTPLFTKSKK